MPTAPSKSKEILKAVEKLRPDELTTFVQDVLKLRAQKVAPCLTATETDLLAKINQALPTKTRTRFEQLSKRRRKESLTAAERREFIAITNQGERLAGQRARALADLATVRKVSVDKLMDQLGFKSM